ncbi:unnamed protein product, partial [Arabidopsis halleri]
CLSVLLLQSNTVSLVRKSFDLDKPCKRFFFYQHNVGYHSDDADNATYQQQSRTL